MGWKHTRKSKGPPKQPKYVSRSGYRSKQHAQAAKWQTSTEPRSLSANKRKNRQTKAFLDKTRLKE